MASLEGHLNNVEVSAVLLLHAGGEAVFGGRLDRQMKWEGLLYIILYSSIKRRVNRQRQTPDVLNLWQQAIHNGCQVRNYPSHP